MSSSGSQSGVVLELAEEFLDRYRTGQRPSLKEYIDRHPELADEIREVFPAMAMMEKIAIADDSLDHSATGVHDHRAKSLPLSEIGDYRIIREVGRGGMGVVYEAEQVSLGRHVALKVLPAQRQLDPVQMERFQLEARSAGRLHHTHIVPVYGIGERDGVHYYAMQFITGCGLDAVIDDLKRLRPGATPTEEEGKTGPGVASVSVSRAAAESLLEGRASPDEEVRGPATAHATAAPPPTDSSALSGRLMPSYFRSVARIGMQVADALAYAHGQGVLHRDIKPSNLLLDSNGEVWVTDFGLAKVEGDDGLTRTGDIVGTLRYMAPERFEGWSDPRSDIYGLGITLYELLTLRHAHEAATRARLMKKILHGAPAPPRAADPSIPLDLETIVLKAIAKEPAERYATARALADDLGNFLAGKPIRARPIGLPERAWRWSRRNPAAAGLVGVSLVAVLALAAVITGSVFVGQLREKNAEINEVNSRLKAANARVGIALGNERAFLYTNRVMFAQRELNEFNPYLADKLLDECPADRRSWEWHFLKRQCHGELFSCDGDTNYTRSVAFSHDGLRVFSAGDTSVQVWDPATGRLLQTWKGYGDFVYGLSVSPDDRQVATASGSLSTPGTVLIRDSKDGRVLRTLDAKVGVHSGVAFSPDGNLLVVAGGVLPAELSRVHVFDAATGLELQSIPTGDEPSVFPSVSVDGRSVLATVGISTSYDPLDKTNRVVVWDVHTGRERFALEMPGVVIMPASFSPEGKAIATGSYDGLVRLWDAETGRLVREYAGHGNCINQVVFSPDGRRLASSSDDNSVRVWDRDSGKCERILSGHRGGIFCLAFHPDNTRLATGGYDGRVKIWDVNTERRNFAFRSSERRAPVFGLAFNPKGDLLATASADRSVKLWEMPAGRLKATFAGHTESVWDVAISPDGRWIASAAGDWRRQDQPGEVRVWDARSGRPAFPPLKAHRGVAWSVAFSPDSSRLASSGGEDRDRNDQVVVWDVSTGREISRFACPDGGSHSVSFSPDGKALCVASGLVAQTRDVETGAALTRYEKHTDVVTEIAFSPDGSRVYSASTDMTLACWDARTGAEFWRLPGNNFSIYGLAISPDGRRAASVGGDMALKVWDTTGGQILLSLRASDAYSVSSVAFSPDGRHLVTSDREGVVKIWDGTPIGSVVAATD